MANENFRKKLTLIAMFSIPTISYGAYSVYFFVSNASKYTEMWRVFVVLLLLNFLATNFRMVTGDMTDLFVAEMFTYYVYNTMILDIIIAIIYIFVWVAIKKNIQGLVWIE